MRPYWEIIGQALREARNSVEESQRTTAQRLDLRPFSSYCEMEDGKADPNVALRALMQKLHEREGAHEDAQRRALRERDEARAEAQRLRIQLNQLQQAASSVVERWEQPSWKDVEPTAGVIYQLRNTIEGIAGEVQKWS